VPGALAWLVACLLVAGCTGRVPPPPVEATPLELTATPFFPQREFHCGPAALATVLGASGVAVEPDQLAPYLYVPGRRGTFQVELAALPRRFDRMAVAIEPRFDALLEQLRNGRPVLVLQNLALERWPRWHYAVVVGYLPDTDQLVLRSGGEPRLRVSRPRFLATWARADGWGVGVVPATADPVGLPRQAWLQAAAALESAGRHGVALAAFDAALKRWPDDPTAALGRANNLYLLDRRDEAAQAWAELLARAPGHPAALHNLAMLRIEEGRPCEALRLLPAANADEAALISAARAAAQAAVAPAACR
jgi:tetratricopeptide (TPR) repeat protein